MLQSLSHLGTLPSVMCSASHPPARLEVLLASSWRQGWRAGGTSWVLSDTLLYELFQGFIQADLKNEIPQAFPQRFAISRAFQTLRAAMPKVSALLPSLDVFTAELWAFSSLAAGPFCGMALCFQRLPITLPARDIYREQSYDVSFRCLGGMSQELFVFFYNYRIME